MRINYKGQFSDCAGRTYRLAEISFDAFNDKEFDKLVRIAEIMETRGWNIGSYCDGWACCQVFDFDEYKEFVTDWKEVKKIVAAEYKNKRS